MNKPQAYACILEMGSNFDATHNFSIAMAELKNVLHHITAGQPFFTQPIGMKNQALFLNQTIIGTSTLNCNELTFRLKEIETLCGRTPDEKKKGIIRMDIDLIKFDNQILKPADWEKEYVKRGLRELGIL